jgi:hypothetical protein
MKRRLLYSAIAMMGALFAMALPNSVQAQVAIWPGSVVAPFVHVEWNGRWVHVCAPFVNLTVDVPRCCGCQPRCYDTCAACTTVAPTIGEAYAHPTRRQIATSASELFDSLEQFQTADSWRQYLELNAGQALSAEQLSRSATSNKQMGDVLRHFDTANRQQQYQPITTLPKFQQLHTLLANYLAQQPRSSFTEVKPANTILTSHTEAAVSLAARAVDTARVERLTDVPRLTNSVEKPKLRHTSEELPPPIEKGGI